jgi:hypothetical protein
VLSLVGFPPQRCVAVITYRTENWERTATHTGGLAKKIRPQIGLSLRQRFAQAWRNGSQSAIVPDLLYDAEGRKELL